MALRDQYVPRPAGFVDGDRKSRMIGPRDSDLRGVSHKRQPFCKAANFEPARQNRVDRSVFSRNQYTESCHGGGQNGNNHYDTNRPRNNTKSLYSQNRNENFGHLWRRFHLWSLWTCYVGEFRSFDVRGNPVYQCGICENNNDLPFAASNRRYWFAR